MRSAEDWKVGDLAERIADHALVRSGEVHTVTEMYRGGYLGFGGRIGGEWNPLGWRKLAATASDTQPVMEDAQASEMHPSSNLEERCARMEAALDWIAYQAGRAEGQLAAPGRYVAADCRSLFDEIEQKARAARQAIGATS